LFYVKYYFYVYYREKNIPPLLDEDNPADILEGLYNAVDAGAFFQLEKKIQHFLKKLWDMRMYHLTVNRWNNIQVTRLPMVACSAFFLYIES
jgi:hypothetical protein